jgi:hypothetical protein
MELEQVLSEAISQTQAIKQQAQAIVSKNNGISTDLAAKLLEADNKLKELDAREKAVTDRETNVGVIEDLNAAQVRITEDRAAFRLLKDSTEAEIAKNQADIKQREDIMNQKLQLVSKREEDLSIRETEYKAKIEKELMRSVLSGTK